MSSQSHTEAAVLPQGWRSRRIDSLVRSSIRDFGSFSMTNLIEFVDEGVPFIKSESVQNGWIDFRSIAYIREEIHRLLYKSCIYAGDILFTKIGAIGRVAVYDGRLGICNSNAATAKIQIDPSEADATFVAYQLGSEQVMREFERTVISTPPRINLGDINAMTIACPLVPEQRKIARILTTVDNLIEKTEALIAKYQAIKQGMMHDLFTRGVDENGHLRPTYEEAPHLYKPSELGWIPKEWAISTYGDVADSLIDGPFGSNLKTEHYVTDPGVRVVRLQNIENGTYNDEDRAWISERHAESLARHQVLPGDTLIASLGDDAHPVGRACLYPEGLPPAINKADCFRLRCHSKQMLNAFAVFSLNADYVQPEVRRFAQGVTRMRMNTHNLRKVRVKMCSLREQAITVQRLGCIEQLINIERESLTKLVRQKQGLMQDLLTGKVRVKVDEPEENTTHA